MMTGNQFSPKAMTISVGDTVRATNLDSVRHDWTDPGVFSSGDLAPGQAYSFRFDSTGRFDFECTIHAGMTGTITVAR